MPVTAKHCITGEEFAAFKKAGIVSRNRSPWASPLHMVPKKDGSWQPCGDYQQLKTITVPDRFPLPNMMDLSANLEGCTVFSKIALPKTFHQVSIAPEDHYKTAVNPPFGLFEYNYMPFGLCKAAQTLQRMQDTLFRVLPCIFVYLDDQHVASMGMEKYTEDLTAVFKILSYNSLAINLEKCEFAVPETFYIIASVPRVSCKK
jgi:hypothetical protein